MYGLEEYERPLIEDALVAATQAAREALMDSLFARNRKVPPPTPLKNYRPPAEPVYEGSSTSRPPPPPRSPSPPRLRSCRDRTPTPAARRDGRPLRPLSPVRRPEMPIRTIKIVEKPPRKRSRVGEILPNGDKIIVDNDEEGTLIEIGGGRK